MKPSETPNEEDWVPPPQPRQECPNSEHLTRKSEVKQQSPECMDGYELVPVGPLGVDVPPGAYHAMPGNRTGQSTGKQPAHIQCSNEEGGCQICINYSDSLQPCMNGYHLIEGMSVEIAPHSCYALPYSRDARETERQGVRYDCKTPLGFCGVCVAPSPNAPSEEQLSSPEGIRCPPGMHAKTFTGSLVLEPGSCVDDHGFSRCSDKTVRITVDCDQSECTRCISEGLSVPGW